MADVLIAVLGSLEIEVSGERIDLKSPSQRVLLERLVIGDGSPVSVDALADAVWGEDLPKDPTNAIRYHIWQLRSVLGVPEVIETVAGGYRLTIVGESVDTHRFSSLVGDARAAPNPERAVTLLTDALSLWRGSPFQEVADLDFAQPEIRRLTELWRTARASRSQALVTAGRTAEAIPELQGMIEADPYNEALWSALMEALYREGRQSDALRAYQRAKDVLGTDLGLEPTPAFARVEEQILLHDDALTPPAVPRTNLPLAITTFVGRTGELRDITRTLGSRRLVTIVGVGGAGKTRLAVETAQTNLGRFRDGAWVCDLTTLRETDDFFETLAGAVGVSLIDPDRTPRAEMISFLRRRQILLILDNCEHVLDTAADAATSILEHCEDTRIIATSRSPLHVPGEVVYPIPVLDLPRGDASWVETLESSAADLLLQRATDAGARIEPSQGNAVRITRLCRVLEGIPLAIELAAARLRSVPLEELTKQLEATLAAYGEQRGTSERHRTMDAMIIWSYDLLTLKEQSLFRRLGVFEGGFTVEAATHVCANDDLPAHLVSRVIDVLAECSLIEPDRTQPARYRILEPLRLFARARLEQANESADVSARHAEAFSDIVIASATHLRGPARNEIFAGFRLESANIRAALEHLETHGEVERLCSMVGALTSFWIGDDRTEEQARWGSACAPHLDATDPATAALISCLLAFAASSSRDPQQGSAYMTSAMEYAHMAGDELVYADVVNFFLSRTDALAFGDLLGPRNDVQLAEEAVEIYTRHDDRWGLVDALTNLCGSILWHERTRSDDVIRIASRARKLATDANDPDRMTWALINQIAAQMATNGEMHPPTADFDDLIEELLRLAPLATSPRTACEAVSQYAVHLFRRGDVDEAIRSISTASTIADEAGLLYSAILAYTTHAIFATEADRDGSIEALLTALDRAEERSVDRQTVWVVEVAAWVLVRRGAAEDAARLIGSAEHQRLDERNEMPAWDLERYRATVGDIRAATRSSYRSLVDEGATWTIPRAAAEASRALSAL